MAMRRLYVALVTWAFVALLVGPAQAATVVTAPPAAAPAAATSPASASMQTGSYVPLAPARILDTRIGSITVDGRNQAQGPIPAGQTRNLPVAGRAGVPASGVAAVVLNVTGVNPTGNGYLTLFPALTTRPGTSNLNLRAGETAANLVVVKLGSGGGVSYYNGGPSVEVIADVAGYYPMGESFTATNPVRVLDTRPTGATVDGLYRATGAYGPGETRAVPLAGRAGVPTTGVAAVVLNLTAVSPTASTYVSTFPSGSPLPTASNLNVGPTQVRANLVLARLGANGQLAIFNSAGSTHMLADVVGWIPTGTSYGSLAPSRLLDTRATLPLGPGQSRDLTVTGRGGVPATGVGAVVLNVTAVAPTSTTYVTVHPSNTARPNASNLNLLRGDTRPNLVIVKVSPTGAVRLFNANGSTHLLVDIAGWFGSSSPPVITTTTLPQGKVGLAYSSQLVASGGTAPLTWARTAGTLPAGLTLSAAGRLSGTPTAAGTTSFTVRALDSAGLMDTQVLSLTVTGAFTITTTTLPPGKVGAPYSAQLGASGGTAPLTWARTVGTLPVGMTLSTAGLLSGTPTAAATSTFTVSATDAAGLTDTQVLVMTVAVPFTITTSTLPQGKVDVSYAAQLATSGGTAPVTYDLTLGGLPSGLSLDTSGAIYGYPTGQGASTFTVRATDDAGRVATRQLSIAVVQFRITTSLPNPTKDLPYSVQLATADGKSPTTWAVAVGSLPTGLTLSGTGLLEGTPTQAGTWTFTLAAHDADFLTASRNYTLVVSQSTNPVIVTTVLAAAQVGVAYVGPVSAVGGTGTRTWTVTAGALPAGLTLEAPTGLVEGRPSATGSFSFTLRVTDGGGGTDTQAYLLPVSATANWPQPGQDGTFASRSTDPTFTSANPAGIQTRWELPGGPGTSPAVVDGVLHSLDLRFGHDETDLVAYDVVTGDVLWWFPAPGCQDLTVTATSVVAACTGGLRAWSRTGNRSLLWDTVTTDPGRSPERIRVRGNTVIACDTGVRGYSLATGARLWQAFLPSGTTCRSLAVSSDTVVVNTYADQVRAYALTGGTLRWSSTGTSALVQGGAAVTTTPTSVVARDLLSGGQLWATPVTDATTVLAASPDTAYVGTFTDFGNGSWGSTVVAVNAVTGGRRWTVDSDSQPTGGAISGNVLWVGWASLPADGRYGGVRPLDLATGAQISQLRFDGPQVFNPVVVAGGHVIAQNRVLGLAPAAPRISTRYLTPGLSGAAYQRTLAAVGGSGAVTWSITSGALPSGVTMSSGGSISGTPTAAGDFGVTLRARDGRGLSATLGYTLRIVAAGASDWSTMGRDSMRAGVNGEESVLSPDTMPSVGQAWTAAPVTTSGRGASEVLGAPVIVGDRVYVAYGSGIVAAFTRTGTGAKTAVWTAVAEPGVMFVSGLTASAGVGYVVSSDGQLYALNLTSGARVWRTSVTPATSIGLQAAPLVVNGTVYWLRDLLHATRVSDGGAAWASPYDPNTSGESYFTEPLSSDGTRVYIGGACVITALNASTGSLAWQRDFTIRTGPTAACNQSGESWGPPVVTAGKVSFSDVNRTYVLEATTGANAGAILRARGGTTTPSPGMAVQALGLPQMFGGFYYTPALTDTRTGEVLWRPGTDLVDSRPVVAGGVVFVRNGSSLRGLDLANGETVWQDTVDGLPSFGTFDSLAVGRGMVVVGSADGSVVAFRPL